jgi:hypothetical protein
VLLDGKELGRNVEAAGPVDLAPDAEHELVVTAPGMVTVRQSLRAAPGAALTVPITLVKDRAPIRTPTPTPAPSAVAPTTERPASFDRVADPPAAPPASHKRGLIRDNPLRP